MGAGLQRSDSRGNIDTRISPYPSYRDPCLWFSQRKFVSICIVLDFTCIPLYAFTYPQDFIPLARPRYQSLCAFSVVHTLSLVFTSVILDRTTHVFSV